MTADDDLSAQLTVESVIERLAAHAYLCERRTATVVFLALKMRRPVLVEGPPGVGKTELAKCLAKALGTELIRLQCYEGLDETKALYEWEYGKQLLYTQLLRGRLDEMLEGSTGLRDAATKLHANEDVFFSEQFLVERPVLRAIRSAEPVVLLVDEIDRADEEFEAFLLEVLSEGQVTLPELGTLTSRSTPIVFLTSNATRDLSEALKRRCLRLSMTYPSEERELAILKARAPALDDDLGGQVVRALAELRRLDLRKAPSISEALDWARALLILNVRELTAEVLEDTLSLLVKYDRDVEAVQQRLARGPITEPMGPSSSSLPGGEDRAETPEEAYRRNYREVLQRKGR